MATIFSFRNYHSLISGRPQPLLLLRFSIIPNPYLRHISGDRRRWLRLSVSAAGNRKAEEEISDDRRAGILAGERRSSAMEVGKLTEKGLASEDGVYEDFEWKWPSWKELPMRYKLIGTTSLAFVVCNMDKDHINCGRLISYKVVENGV